MWCGAAQPNHRARPVGQEAKRPPRGGGPGAAKSEIWHIHLDQIAGLCNPVPIF